LTQTAVTRSERSRSTNAIKCEHAGVGSRTYNKNAANEFDINGDQSHDVLSIPFSKFGGMKYKVYIAVCTLAIMVACQDRSSEPHYTDNDTAAVYDDEHILDMIELYSGERFRNVRVKKIGDSTFEVSGEAQVFEAAFNWVIEDGHNELKQGYGTTDAGAPAWGKFSFEVTAAKHDPDTMLHLILFEASAKDGSRQHELPIVLYR